MIYKLKTSAHTPGGRGAASSNLVIPTIYTTLPLTIN